MRWNHHAPAQGPWWRGLLASLLICSAVSAQPTPPPSHSAPSAAEPPPLKSAPHLSMAQLLEQAWARQSEARAAPWRQQSLARAQAASRSWLADTPSLLLQGQTDRPGSGQGERELEVGLALPLWRPGQSVQAQAASEADLIAYERRLHAQRWRLAAEVREAWWQAQRMRVDVQQAQTRLNNARQLAQDVARRVQAGDLARADQHQADSAVAQSRWSLAQAEGEQDAALQRLRQLSGDWSLSIDQLPVEGWVQPPVDIGPPPLPGVAPASHPWLVEADAREAQALSQARLAEASRLPAPELTVLGTRTHGTAGEPDRRSLTVGIQWPFEVGGPTAARADAQVLAAWALAHEAEAERMQVQEQIRAQMAQAQGRLKSAQAQWNAAREHVRLAHETRGFFDRSFQMGHTDLPTRLRVEHEAALAERALQRARIELSAAWSDWRQALGELPTE
jgi:cobalt-zinc-cadmium efflux system outer membrane protein